VTTHPGTTTTAMQYADQTDAALGIKYGVVVRVAKPESGNNLAAAMDLYSERDGKFQVEPMLGVALRRPVFCVGEILILAPDGREVAFPGRKPGKWDVDVETFDNVRDAILRAKTVIWE
jgi:hypothetical protein